MTLASSGWDLVGLRERIDEWERLSQEWWAMDVPASWRGTAGAGPVRRRAPLSASAVDRYQRDFGVGLPADYTSFLTELADGHDPGSGVLRPLRQSGGDEAPLRIPVSGSDLAAVAFPPGRVLEIGDLGCGMAAVLVIAGPNAGEMWEDGGADDDRLEPATLHPPSFRGYYEWALDRAVERQRRQIDDARRVLAERS